MRFLMAVCTVVVIAGLSPVASGSVIILSQLSNKVAPPAEVLDATLDFNITGASQLRLSATNDTVAPDAYNINLIYFNATPNVTGLALDSVTSSVDGDITGAWLLNTGQKADDAFGTFDFELADGVGQSIESIQSGETVDFVFTISGQNPYAAENFTTELSTVTPDEGEIPCVGAGKFINAENDGDSAYGGTVPEPATLGLVALGLVGLTLRGRRRG